jgi:tRNA (guanine-N7-)-methyltransferase
MMDHPKENQRDRYEAFLRRRAERIQRLREDLQELFPDRSALTLELGCGHGHFLTAFAEAHPQARCLGVDLVSKRIRKARAKAGKRGLDNLAFLKAEVGELLDAWPETLPVERIFVLFPDPWPKKRHAKNRILQLPVLDRLACRAQPDTCLHFRTDHPGNFSWNREQIALHPLWEIDPLAEWPFESSSFFQELLPDYQSFTARCRPPDGMALR